MTRRIGLDVLVIVACFAIVFPAIAEAQRETRPGRRPVPRPAPAPTGVDAQLSPEIRQALEAVPNEGTPETQRFYFRSNEWRQDLLAPHLTGRGGACVGVGSDQNYTMAAMAGCELFFGVDFDARIPFVHKLYSVLVPASESADALIARFAEENTAETAQMLTEGLASDPDRDEIVRRFQRHREEWYAYLGRVKALVDARGQGFSWLSSPALYEHIRKLHTNGRVFARNGDVTGARTIRALGEALRRAGITVRVVYFSNAEQFFRYTPSFVENMASLPTDERSVVVRTIRGRSIPVDADPGRWHYVVHDFPDFLDRLRTGAYGRSFAFMSDLLAAGAPHFGGESGISTMTASTPRPMLEQYRERLARRRGRGARAARE